MSRADETLIETHIIDEEMGVELQIHNDPYPVNPRTEYDNVGVMACWHRRYDLGDKDAQDKLADAVQASGYWIDGLEAFYDLSDPRDINEVLPQILDLTILPLYLYDHGALTISTAPFSCTWDSGQIGWIFCTAETVEKEFGGDRAKAEAYLVGEVEAYDRYLRGESYGYIISTPDDEHADSCWGYDSETYCTECGRDAAEHVLHELRHQRACDQLQEWNAQRSMAAYAYLGRAPEPLSISI